MANYKNKKCIVCKELFSDYDDIVVCPECGAPYHRECYKLTNKCIYESSHGTDEAYHEENSCEEFSCNIKECPRCNNENPKDANFCNKCGYIFISSENQSSYEHLKNEIPFMFDPMGGISPDEDMNGITAGELAKFVGSNTPYYMNVFKKIKDEKKGKFNFSAFLFSGVWFLYRKQYKIGTILTTIAFSLIISTFLIGYFYTIPMLSSTPNIPFISKTLSIPLYQILLFLIQLLDFFLMLFSGLYANKAYYKHCIKKVKKIKEMVLEKADYNEEIQRKGGVNLNLIWIIFVCYTSINFLARILFSK